MHIIYFSQTSGSLLDERQVRSIMDEIKQVMLASSSRKQERADRAKVEDFDTEEGELLKEENELEEEVFEGVWFIHVFLAYWFVNFICFCIDVNDLFFLACFIY